ncbi:ABC transporter ATP-binding protein [Solimonas marina]|uniref:ABC transporter ATP-binding protein n=1 Tax=Solimonas marina TaxID=2714601 RepID=A0A969WC37_9GAMM|nr:ABC transporter ATP-binding protein [Solimonas marina]NKF23298.1 ABC transporter ATP-binding protein [Solimonas marina]
MTDTQKRSGFGLIWRIITAVPPGRNALVALAITFAGAAEGIGIATVLPLVAVLGDNASKSNALSKAILSVLDAIGLPHDPILLLCIIGGGLLTKAAVTLLALRLVGRTVAEVVANLRLELIDAVMRARWSFYVRQPVGRFSTALSGEAQKAGEAYNGMTQMFSQSTQALIYLMIAAVASWRLALLAVLVSAIMIVSLNRLLVASKNNARAQTGRMRSLVSRLTDVLVGIKPMKAMARQARFNALFTEDLKAIKKSIRRQVFAKNTNKALQEPILALCLLIGIYFALKVFAMPVGEVIVMGLLLTKTVSVVGKAQQELQNIYANESGFSAVYEVTDAARAERETASGKAVPTLERGFAFDDVSFAFGERQILRHASFTVNAGEIIALTGPSGAGKTTLVDLLLGLQEPAEGTVRVDGVPLHEIDVLKWRAQTGYVPQELILFHDSVFANITLGQPEFSHEDAEHALRRAGAWDFVANLSDGIDTIAGERGALLSGGQRQRIAVARALVHRPKLLILDEATSALDPQTEQLIVRNVCQLAREKGLTVLAISHHPAWVEVADRVLRLEDGDLVEQLHEGQRAAV